MSETKIITKLYVITDTENGYDKIGDIDGGLFEEKFLIDYIKKYGHQPIIDKLSSMITQVVNTKNIINNQNNLNYLANQETIDIQNFIKR